MHDWPRWVGADPARVAILVGGIDRATHGYQILQRESGKAALFDARTRGTLLIVIGILASLFISMGVVLLRGAGASLGAGVALVVGVGQVLLLFALAPAYVLDHDDARVLGHWPVTGRDVAVARLAALARPLRDLTWSFATLPCLLLAIFVKPWGLAGLVTALAVIAQGLALLLSFVAALLLARRWLGPEGARRHVRVIGGSLAIVAYVAMQFSSRTEGGGGPPSPLVFAMLPLFWYAGWPILLTGLSKLALFGFAASLLWLVLLMVAAVRLTVSSSTPERPGTARGGSSMPGLLFETLLAPWLRDRHGRVLRRVALAHWRDDSRFIVGVLHVPVIVLALVVMSARFGVSDRAGAVVMLAPLAMMFGLSAVLQSIGSSRPEALWVVASAPLATRGWAGAQRGLARAVSLGPMVFGVVALGMMARAQLMTIVDGVVVAVLFFEIASRAVQLQVWRLPFSRRVLPGENDGAAMLGAVGLIVLPLVAVWMWLVHEPHVGGKLATYVVATVAVAALHRAGRRREAREPLRSAVTQVG